MFNLRYFMFVISEDYYFYLKNKYFYLKKKNCITVMFSPKCFNNFTVNVLKCEPTFTF